jgi:hypothetical protein
MKREYKITHQAKAGSKWIESCSDYIEHYIRVDLKGIGFFDADNIKMQIIEILTDRWNFEHDSKIERKK